MTTTDELTRLQDAARLAAERAERARAAAERAAAVEAERRAAREREWDQRVLDEYDPAALRAASDTALRDVERAVADGDNPFPKWLAYHVEHRRWYERTLEANGAAPRLGRPALAPVPSVNEDFDSVLRRAGLRRVSSSGSRRDRRARRSPRSVRRSGVRDSLWLVTVTAAPVFTRRW
jgi:hypothetical protein